MQLGGREFRYRVADGTRLSGREYGDRTLPGTPVVCLAGFSRNVRDFDALARHLSAHHTNPRRVISFDYRGRGNSDKAPPKTYTPQTETTDILAGLTACGVHEACFVGTSRGGIICMAIGVLRPGMLRAVVLNDIGPVIQIAYLAGLKEHFAGNTIPSTWDQAKADIERAYSGTFTAMDADDWDRVARQFYFDHDGKPDIAFDPGIANELQAINEATPAISIWPQFLALSHIPILALRGANSPLLDADTFSEMGSRHPNCRQHEVPDQGHAPLLWDKETQSLIADFFDSVN